MKCKYEKCNNETDRIFCSVSCAQKHRYSLVKVCKQCGEPKDRGGLLCTACVAANIVKSHKIENPKRTQTRNKISKFIQRTELPMRDDIVAIAYGWML